MRAITVMAAVRGKNSLGAMSRCADAHLPGCLENATPHRVLALSDGDITGGNSAAHQQGDSVTYLAVGQDYIGVVERELLKGLQRGFVE